ncbi:MAG: hypothetical protein PHV32_16995 [Eubacteriales bacterium]|nr:hypothetical protein [Kiritimatiellia bacterium]MDD4496009.1 hypothetical protein [Eubacteriales bacterium]
MPIMLKRRNGEITQFRNAEFIPAYYFIPKSVSAKCGAELNSVPRRPYELLHCWDAIAVVESDLFRLLIIDAYAFMVWPFIGLGAKREIYSGYEPSWIFAHSPAYWIQKMIDEKIIPTAQELLKNGGVTECFGYVSEEEISTLFSWIVPQTMAHQNMIPVIAVAEEYRNFEDFDYRSSRQKTDFYRKWYHTRTAHPQISLEAYQEEYTEAHGGQEWDMPDNIDVELDVTTKLQVDDFLATLSEKDKQILKLRMQGLTLEEIGKELGFQNHSGVLKRIRKIGKLYEKYSGEDFGFSEKRIVAKAE